MDYIDKQLFNAEQALARLSEQAEQEAAMLAVLPVRFSKNMDAFNKYLPDIYSQFVSYSPSRAFRIFCNENGIPNLLWLDDGVSFYGADPYDECRKQIERILHGKDSVQTFDFVKDSNPLEFIHVDFMNEMVEMRKSASDKLSPISHIGDSIPLAIMFGVGLGYQMAYLYEQCKLNVFYIVEPDQDVFYASLFTFDWYSLLDYINSERLGLHIFLGQNNNEIMQDLSMAIAKSGSYLSSANIGFWHYPSEEIFELMKRTKQEFFLLSSGWGFFDDNIISISHCVENVRKNLPFLITGKSIDENWSNIPVFVVGNGPSLDLAIDTLKKLQDNVIILSCGSALSALHKAGIRPDIHVQVERTKLVPDSHRLLNDADYLKDILFLSLDVIHPDCAEQFDRVGLAFKPLEPGGFLLQLNYPIARQRDILRGANPLVGNTGVATACRLGFKSIYLFGIDNGYKSNQHHHSKLSFYFDEDGKAKEKLSSLVLRRSKHLVPGNFGGQVETTNMMINSRMVIENQLKLYSDACVYNCSDGAAINGALPTKIEDIICQDNKLDKTSLINHIINDLYGPMDINVESLVDKLNVEFFDELIDKFVSDWDAQFSSRQNIIELMMQQYDYLSAISQTRYSHIYRCLIGSVNYSFSVILSTMYRFEESDLYYSYINNMIATMRNYLSAMKDRYKHAMSSVDQKEHGLFDAS